MYRDKILSKYNIEPKQLQAYATIDAMSLFLDEMKSTN